MTKLSKRETTIFFIALVLVVCFAAWQIMSHFQQNGKSGINQRIRAVHEEILKYQRTAAMGPDIHKHYDHLTKLIGQAGSDGAEMSSLLAKIEGAAGETNIHIINMQPQQATDQKGLRFFPVDLQIEGSWANIVHFAYVLQSRPNYFFIQDLHLEKNSDTADDLRGRIVASSARLTYSLPH